MSTLVPTDATLREVRRIIDEIARPSSATVTPETDLFASTIIDSFNMIEIIERIEEQFAIAIAMEDLTVQNFGTIAAIAGTVDGYRRRASAA